MFNNRQLHVGLALENNASNHERIYIRRHESTSNLGRCGRRPSNPCEFMAAHLLKYNPLKDKYPEDEPKPPKILEEVCEESDEDDEDDPCGCKRFLKKECADEKAATAAEEKKAKETAADVKQLAKRSTIAADAKKSVTAPDAARESMVKALSKKKSIK